MIGRVSGRHAFAAFSDPGVSVVSARTNRLWCRFIRDPEPGLVRVAFAIGRRCGGAVERNRLRRRLRVIVDRAAAQHGLSAGSMLIGARPAATTLTFAALTTEVDALIGRLSTAVQS